MIFEKPFEGKITDHPKHKYHIESICSHVHVLLSVQKWNSKHLFLQLSDYPYRPLLLPPSQSVGHQAAPIGGGGGGGAPIGGGAKCHQCTKHKCPYASGSLRSLDQHPGLYRMESLKSINIGSIQIGDFQTEYKHSFLCQRSLALHHLRQGFWTFHLKKQFEHFISSKFKILSNKVPEHFISKAFKNPLWQGFWTFHLKGI